ncbi:hypothetical protein LXL04_004221 [Taraxacum kok-saghyz]
MPYGDVLKVIKQELGRSQQSFETESPQSHSKMVINWATVTQLYTSKISFNTESSQYVSILIPSLKSLQFCFKDSEGNQIYLIIMEAKKITMIKDLTLDRDDYTIKVRIIRLWKLNSYSNRNHVYEINMILMDEEGAKIQCNVEASFIQKLRNLLQEYADLYIEKPTIGLSVGTHKNVPNEHRLYFYYTTIVSKCTDFDGPVHGFSFVSYQSLLENSIPKETTFDIIGDVVNLLTDSSNNEYAKQMMAYVESNPDKTSLTIILQFGRLNFYMGRAYVNNTFHATKLFINDKVPDILSFKRKLLATSSDQISSSHRTISSSIVYSLNNEFLSKTNFYKISAIHGLEEGSSAIVIGTIKVIEQDQPWFYLACSKCRKKVQVVKATNDESATVAQNLQPEVYWCSNTKPECQNNVISACPRFIVPLWTINMGRREYILQDGCSNGYPSEFTELVDKKYAFKVVVGKFNSVKNVRYYNVSKITDVVDIISELDIMDRKLSNDRDVETDSENVSFSQETVTLKVYHTQHSC